MAVSDKEKMIVKLVSAANTHSIAAKLSGDVGATGYHLDMAEPLCEAAEMMKRMYTPDEVCGKVSLHGQHDHRFKLGETIRYSPSEILKILKEE